ncbi:GNAT family N-acetyltransferase [Agromyces soli]|uniref:GNAT family N-acetyltransferase n=1 Tax=Agromyces soli TaxID=659012 RepID=A0ABY4ASD8_9MICO|nr:GNAT family N-acetyltransferase [Agromyces soli]UOE26068.1 GNAT family N-acetyltransferase [Agromyces soli]
MTEPAGERALPPLSERVRPTAPPRLAHPDVAEWRAVGEPELDAVAELERAISEADHPEYSTTRDDLADELGMSFVDRGRDSIVGLDGSGRAIAWGLVQQPPGQDTLVRSIVMGGVHPKHRRRSVGRLLLAWQRARAEQQLAASERRLPGWIMAFSDDRAAGAAPLFGGAGFAAARFFAGLRRDLAEPIEPLELVDGLSLERLSPERFEQVRTARNDAFRDHWGSQPSSAEQWRAFVSRTAFRPSLSFVAVDPAIDRAVGFVLADVDEDDWARQGFSSSHVPLVGVARAARGRGVASALLAAHLRATAEEGIDFSTLEVDAASPTGAFALYERMGYRPAARETGYTIVY